jgi:hypothetical protein
MVPSSSNGGGDGGFAVLDIVEMRTLANSKLNSSVCRIFIMDSY